MSIANTRKTVVQVYKAGSDWHNSTPPGIGDYIRGLASLDELGREFGFDVVSDVSQSDYAKAVDQDQPLFHVGDPAAIRKAGEYFTDHNALLVDLWRFVAKQPDEVLYISTNLGHPQRGYLPDETRRYLRQWFNFRPEVSVREALSLLPQSYGVLSIRCGDIFFKTGGALSPPHRKLVLETIEDEVAPVAPARMVVMSDSEDMADLVAKTFGFLRAGRSEHGGLSGAASVCRDLDLLANSGKNFHINAWANWWSGFSHYTSLICGVPSINFADVKPPPRGQLIRAMGRRVLG